MTSAERPTLWPEALEQGEHNPIDPLFENFTPLPSQDEPPMRLLPFVEASFAIVEPRNPYTPGRHIAVIAAHLERLTYHAKAALAAAGLLTDHEADTWDEISNLLVNIPPRYMKSLLISVIWPAWVWTLDPGARFLFNSYRERLSVRDNVKTRRLIESGWYRDRWGERVRIVQGQNEKMRFDLEGGGFRTAGSVEGGNTGEGGDYVVADDPHNLRQIWSDTKRKTVIDWWDDVMSSRTGRYPTNRKIVVMQRGHEEDLSGHILAEHGNYVHIFLPQEYNPSLKPGRPDVPARSQPSPLGPIDWRTEPGQLLWEERFDQDVVQGIKESTSAYAYDSQYQQVPAPAEGDIFKRWHWRFWEPPQESLGPITLWKTVKDPDGIEKRERLIVVPRKLPLRGQSYDQAWDFTFKGKSDNTERDYVAGWEFFKAGLDTFVMDRIHQQMDFLATLSAMRAMRRMWPETRRTWYEDAANGPAIASTLRAEIPGLIPVRADGDLVSRSHAITYLIEGGHVYLPHPVMCPWVWEVIEHFSAFPNAAHDDDIAAAVVGLRKLYPVPPRPPDRERFRRAGKYPVFQKTR